VDTPEDWFDVELQDEERKEQLLSQLDPGVSGDTPGKFPLSAMIGSLGELAIVLGGANNESPEEFLFANSLTLAGATMSGNFRLNIGLSSDTRLSTATIGESATVKKTTSQNQAADFFRSLGLTNVDTCYGVGSAEGLAEKLKKINRVVLAYDELKSLMAKAEIKGATLLPIIAQLFETLYYENLTKGSCIKFEDARLSLMANCTTDTYQDLWSHEAVAIGLPNRLFLVHAKAKPKQAWPEPPDEVSWKHYASASRPSLLPACSAFRGRTASRMKPSGYGHGGTIVALPAFTQAVWIPSGFDSCQSWRQLATRRRLTRKSFSPFSRS
jgi:hypothetical protein